MQRYRNSHTVFNDDIRESLPSQQMSRWSTDAFKGLSFSERRRYGFLACHQVVLIIDSAVQEAQHHAIDSHKYSWKS